MEILIILGFTLVATFAVFGAVDMLRQINRIPNTKEPEIDLYTVERLQKAAGIEKDASSTKEPKELIPVRLEASILTELLQDSEENFDRNLQSLKQEKPLVYTQEKIEFMKKMREMLKETEVDPAFASNIVLGETKTNKRVKKSKK